MAQDPNVRDAQFAAEFDADVGAQHVAGVYAEGFLGAAENAGRTEELLAEFDSFLSDVLDLFPSLEQVLASRLVSAEDKIALLHRVLASQASPIFLNFLKVVARHERLEILRAIHRQTHEQYDRLRGRVRVQVATATPVPEELAHRITQNLAGVVGGEPILQRVVDPDLIGGIVLRVGDTVYDASIANQLKQLRQQMMDRSAHEIQSRRDRFRYPARD
jgi:F-type H+-transporting ATPase subunit delta